MTFSKILRFKYVYIVLILLGIITISLAFVSKSRAIVANPNTEISFSYESGFYNDEIDLAISSPRGEIFYTLDGSLPTKNSIKYDGPIHLGDASLKENVYSMREDVSVGFYEDFIDEYSIYEAPGYKAPVDKVDKCNVVRAVAYYGEDNYSPVRTASYFVGFENKPEYDSVKVVSLITDPANLFDYNSGIYVTGEVFDNYKESIYNQTDWFWASWKHWLANYSKGMQEEKEAVFELFDEDELLFSQNVGVRIHGGKSRSYNPKSLNLYACKKYGAYDHFMYDFFGNNKYADCVTLFMGGDDYVSKAKDYLANTLFSDLEVATMEFVPCVMFLDGEYWGLYYITEKYDSKYFNSHYNVKPDNVVFIKNSELEEGEEEDFNLYVELMEFVNNSDMTQKENYEKFCNLVDVDSFLDYYAAFLYCGRGVDWPAKNIGMWRARKTGQGKYNDGRWRFVIFDANSSGMSEDTTMFDNYENALNDMFFASLMRNEELKSRLFSRMAELGEHEFNKISMTKVLDEFEKTMGEQCRKNMNRFHGEGSESLYDAEMESVRFFFENRQEYIKELCRKYGFEADE